MIADSKRIASFYLVHLQCHCHSYKVNIHFIVDVLGNVRWNFQESSSTAWWCETGHFSSSFFIEFKQYIPFVLTTVFINSKLTLLSSWCISSWSMSEIYNDCYFIYEWYIYRQKVKLTLSCSWCISLCNMNEVHSDPFTSYMKSIFTGSKWKNEFSFQRVSGFQWLPRKRRKKTKCSPNLKLR